MKRIEDANLNVSIVKKLIQLLQGNPYAQFLRQLKDYAPIEKYQICIIKDVKLDQRVYNSPTADQVAAIWIEGNNPRALLERDIIVHAHSGQRHNIKHYFSCYDPLQYPMLFPKGQLGWHQSIDKCVIPMSTSRSTTSTSPTFTSAEDIINQEQRGTRYLYLYISSTNYFEFNKQKCFNLRSKGNTIIYFIYTMFCSCC